MSNWKSKSPTNNRMSTNLDLNNDDDDWDTDPDFVRDMDEMDQRWGSKRTVGSINMSKLIDEVHHDHKSIMKEKFLHPSQATTTSSTRKIMTTSSSTSSSSFVKDTSSVSPDHHHHQQPINGSTISDMKKSLFENSSKFDSTRVKNNPSTTKTKPLYEHDSGFKSTLDRFKQGVDGPKGNNLNREEKTSYNKNIHGSTSSKEIPIQQETTTTTKSTPKQNKYLREPILTKSTTAYEQTSKMRPTITSTSSKPKDIVEEIEDDVPKAFHSIQAKIEAYKKELEELQNKVAQKAELAKTIKKTSPTAMNKTKNIEENTTNIQYVDRNENGSNIKNFPDENPLISESIKSMREKFDSLCREGEDDFRRRTEAKRKEFFDEIKNQVRETRRGLDGFDDPIDEEFEDMKKRFLEKTQKMSSNKIKTSSTSQSNSPRQQQTPSPSHTKINHNNSQTSLGSPKIYTKRETHREEVVSKIVKENDKVIENETKRNVEHSSSHHGSSEDEEHHIERAKEIPITLKHHQTNNDANDLPKNNPKSSSPSHQSPRTESPVDRIKRQNPTLKPSMKGAGLMARTLYDYQAAETDELSFEVDDLITNIEKIDQGWYKGTMTFRDGKKREGLFPANYVKLLNDDGEF